MADNKNFKDFADPLMIIKSSLELIKFQYDDVMDRKILAYLNRIEKASQKIESLLKEVESKHEVYNK